MDYSWPGNVRELENVMEHAFVMLEGEKTIELYHLPDHLLYQIQTLESSSSVMNLDAVRARTEKEAILKVLKYCGGNKKKAAELLGIHRSSFYQKLKKYGIEGRES